MPYYKILMTVPCTQVKEIEVYAKSKDEIKELFEYDMHIDRDPEQGEPEDIAYYNCIADLVADLVEISNTVDTYYNYPITYENIESITELY